MTDETTTPTSQTTLPDISALLPPVPLYPSKRGEKRRKDWRKWTDAQFNAYVAYVHAMRDAINAKPPFDTWTDAERAAYRAYAREMKMLRERPMYADHPYDTWSEAEKAAYSAYISAVRSCAGKFGGRRVPAKGRGKFCPALCRTPDYEVLIAYAHKREISVAEVLHELAEQVKTAYPDICEGASEQG